MCFITLLIMMNYKKIMMNSRRLQENYDEYKKIMMQQYF